MNIKNLVGGMIMAVYYDDYCCEVIDSEALIPVYEGADKKNYKRVGFTEDEEGREYTVYKSARNWYAVLDD